MMWNVEDKHKLIVAFVMSVLAGLATQGICYILARLFGYFRLWEIFVIATLAGSATIGIIKLVSKGKFRYRKISVVFGLGVALVTYAVGIGFFTLKVVKTWDFENDTTQGWGIYDEDKGRVIQSPDVVVKAGEFAKDTLCLEVNNIDISTTSTLGASAVKKWPAVYYEGGLSKAKVTALVYVPAIADFRFADAKFFLFAGSSWEWHDSGRGQYNEGVILQPGKWVKLSWDLRRHRTWRWPKPWRNILGIQLYVEGTFRGPIYIDNVVIYK